MRRVAACAAAALALACSSSETASRDDVLFVATTTVEDTGLLEALAAGMRRDLPDLRIRIIAVGSGQALALARRGDADLVLVHDPAAESTFVAQGHGDRRRTIMRNDFVLIGPAEDPAEAQGADDIVDALRRIATARRPFLSRGDSSGTHRMEVALWTRTGARPAGEWYREAGIGQGDLIRMADELGAYAVVDRGTFRSLAGRIGLVVLHDHGAPLDNPYSAIVAARARNPAGARAVADWLDGPAARTIIDAFGRAGHGSPLFEPVD
jgi:tungstate transport system substrate-binding protein